MRLGFIAFALLSGGAGNAQPTALAAGEVLLQLSATGKVASAPDTITILVPIAANAATAAAARAANQAKIDHLKAALAVRGIGPAMISMRPPTAQFGFIGNEAYAAGENELPPAAIAAMGRKSAQSLMQIVVARQEQVEIVRGVLDSEDLTMAGAPVPALRDDGTARASATKAALDQARLDAGSYASPLGLKVVRIARMANYGEQRAADWQNAAAMMQQMFAGTSSDRQVVTTSTVWIDFVLAPR